MKPRGIRNNNPLNIRHSADQWQGVREEQTDKSFVQFKSMAYGYRAAWKTLQSYYNRFCLQGKAFTVRNIIHRWAPPNENDTQAYIRTIVQLSGIGEEENLLPPKDVNSYIRLSGLLAAMTCVECGLSYKKVDNEAIFKGYRLAFPENVKALDEWLEAEDEYSNW
jgi:hypothetical protein